MQLLVLVLTSTVVVPLYRTPSLAHRRPQRTFALFRFFYFTKVVAFKAWPRDKPPPLAHPLTLVGDSF